MTNGRRQTKAILKAIARGEDRSSLFWWMVEHHDEILAAAEGRRIQWGTFCTEATRLGLTDTKGKPPTTRNARETLRIRSDGSSLGCRTTIGRRHPLRRLHR